MLSIKNGLIPVFEDEIESIELIGDMDTIDITVEDTHCFFANDIYTHNSALGAELLTLDSIAEAFQKCFPADFIMTISRTIKERESGLGKFFIAKNRNGPDGIIYKVFIDTATSKFEILPTSPEDTAHTNQNSGKGLSLKEILAKHKENRTN